MSSQWPTEAIQQKSFAVAMHGPDEAEIVEMRAAVIGVVEQESVAGLQVVAAGRRVARDLVDHGLHREGHGADEDRQAGRTLHERRAGLGVIEAVAGVARFGDDRIEGGAIKRRVHLVGDLFEPAFQHRERDGIEGRSLALLLVAATEREHFGRADHGVERVEIEHAAPKRVGRAVARQASA